MAKWVTGETCSKTPVFKGVPFQTDHCMTIGLISGPFTYY